VITNTLTGILIWHVTFRSQCSKNEPTHDEHTVSDPPRPNCRPQNGIPALAYTVIAHILHQHLATSGADNEIGTCPYLRIDQPENVATIKTALRAGLCKPASNLSGSAVPFSTHTERKHWTISWPWPMKRAIFVGGQLAISILHHHQLHMTVMIKWPGSANMGQAKLAAYAHEQSHKQPSLECLSSVSSVVLVIEQTRPPRY
jgi:hypothetical protein